MSFSNPTERTAPTLLLWNKQQPLVPEVENGAESCSGTDERLLTALKGKDRESLAELFRRYSRLIFSIGLRVLQNAHEAEEIVQEVFLFLYQRAELFDERKGGAKAWLVRIAYHRSLDRREYLNRRNFYFGTNVELLADTLTGKGDVERDVELKMSRERLKEAFEKLSDRQRLTLELFFFEGIDFQDIAGRLDESIENIRHHYYRGLQKLRKDAFVRKLRNKTQS